MAKIDKLEVEEKKILWSDRKRILGMPISFTRYSVDEDRLYVKKGFFRLEMDEILLYRVLDIKLTQSLWQKLFGVGTLRLYSADQTNSELLLKNVKKPQKLLRYLSGVIEKNRQAKGIAGREIVGMASAPVHGAESGHCDNPEHEHFDAPPAPPQEPTAPFDE